MKPLGSIGIGLLIVWLSVRVSGYDVLPDPAGWLLVLIGVAALRGPREGLLTGLGTVALLVSAVLWLPGATDAVLDGDPSLAWAATVPQLAFLALLAHELSGVARSAGDLSAASWLGIARSLTVVVGVLPVLVFGAGLDQLEEVSYAAAAGSLLLTITLLAAYSGRPWARVPARSTADRHGDS